MGAFGKLPTVSAERCGAVASVVLIERAAQGSPFDRRSMLVPCPHAPAAGSEPPTPSPLSRLPQRGRRQRHGLSFATLLLVAPAISPRTAARALRPATDEGRRDIACDSQLAQIVPALWPQAERCITAVAGGQFVRRLVRRNTLSTTSSCRSCATINSAADGLDATRLRLIIDICDSVWFLLRLTCRPLPAPLPWARATESTGRAWLRRVGSAPTATRVR